MVVVFATTSNLKNTTEVVANVHKQETRITSLKGQRSDKNKSHTHF